MKDSFKFKFSDSDIEEKIKLGVLKTLYYYDLDLTFGVMPKGKLLLVYEDASGRRVPLKIISKEGIILGGYAYFLEGKAIDNLYFIALEETEILKVSAERSRELLSDRDFLFQCLKSSTMASFSLIEELIYRLDNNLEKFMAYILLNYSEDGRMKIKNFSLFAEFMKCSRSNFYVVLGKLIEGKAVKKDGRIITIIDWEKLKALAEI